MKINNYYYETLNECEKELISKSLDMDIIYAANANLFECFIRFVRSIMICSMILNLIISIITQNSGFMIIFAILLILYIIGKVLMSWVKYNYDRAYTNNKCNLVDAMLSNCRQYKESPWEDWERKQTLKRLTELVGIEVDWNKAK